MLVNPHTSPAVKTILCPVDFSEQSKFVVEHSLRVSEVFNADITVLNVVDDMDAKYAAYRKTEKDLQMLRRTMEQDSQNQMTTQIAPKFRNRETKYGFVTAYGKAIDQIPRFSKEKNVGLIMMATRSAGLTNQFILGSTTYKIVRTAPCPLMIFSRPEQKFRALRILFPTDFSPLSLQALPYAYKFAKEYGSDFHLVHFHQMHGEVFKESAKELETMKRDAQRNGVAHVTLNDEIKGVTPGSAILKYAKENNIDLIVISAHGASGYKQFFLGSTAIDITSRSECPVLIVRKSE